MTSAFNMSNMTKVSNKHDSDFYVVSITLSCWTDSWSLKRKIYILLYVRSCQESVNRCWTGISRRQILPFKCWSEQRQAATFLSIASLANVKLRLPIYSLIVGDTHKTYWGLAPIMAKLLSLLTTVRWDEVLQAQCLQMFCKPVSHLSQWFL